MRRHPGCCENNPNPNLPPLPITAARFTSRKRAAQSFLKNFQQQGSGFRGWVVPPLHDQEILPYFFLNIILMYYYQRIFVTVNFMVLIFYFCLHSFHFFFLFIIVIHLQ